MPRKIYVIDGKSYTKHALTEKDILTKHNNASCYGCNRFGLTPGALCSGLRRSDENTCLRSNFHIHGYIFKLVKQ